jgi:hypothetical protein
MNDKELLRCAQYELNNGPPDNLYVIPVAYAPSASPRAINNFPAFSRRLKTIRYPKDFKPAIEKYDGRSDPSTWLKMYSITAHSSGGNEDHMAGYFLLVIGKVPLLWLDKSSCGVHHLMGDLVMALHDQLPGDLQSPLQHTTPRQSADEA